MTAPDLPTIITPWFDVRNRLLAFDARLQGTSTLVTVNPQTVTYIEPGSFDGATILHFVGGTVIEIVCPIAGMQAALLGGETYWQWQDMQRKEAAP